MLSITYRNRKWTSGKKTKVTDMTDQARRRKWIWAGHVSRIQDNRWTLRITTWKSYEGKRSRGRPTRQWKDKLDDYRKGNIYQRMAEDRQTWKHRAEAFAQPRDTYTLLWNWVKYLFIICVYWCRLSLVGCIRCNYSENGTEVWGVLRKWWNQHRHRFWLVNCFNQTGSVWNREIIY